MDGDCQSISLGTSVPPFPAVALGIFSQNPVSMAPPWGRFPLGGAKGDAGQCRFEDGQGAGSSPAQLSQWGEAWPFPRPSWNAGLLGGIERKCDFPSGV